MRTPGGRMPWFSCSILACSASRTTDGFSPRRMSTMPSTASGSWSRVTTPRRGKAPTVTRARSRMRIGIPPRAATTTCSMSPASASAPRPRTTYCSSPCSITFPPALAFERPSASNTWRSVTPRAWSCSGSTCTWYCFTKPPNEPGEPVHLLLDGERHLPLDLLRSVPLEEGNDLDLGVGQLGEGLDRQVPEGDRPCDGEGHREPENGERLGEGEREDAAHRRALNSKGGASVEARMSKPPAIGRVANGLILARSAPTRGMSRD